MEKVEKPVEQKQEKRNEYVKVEEEEEKLEVKLFIVEAFTSLFSK